MSQELIPVKCNCWWMCYSLLWLYLLCSSALAFQNLCCCTSLCWLLPPNFQCYVNRVHDIFAVSNTSGVGSADASAPQMFWIDENPWKSGQKWHPTLFDLKKMALNVCRKTHEDWLFLEFILNKGLHDLCGGRNFSDKLGKVRAKILRTTKNLPAPTPMSNTKLVVLSQLFGHTLQIGG